MFTPQVNSTIVISRDKQVRAISGRQEDGQSLRAANLWFTRASRLSEAKYAQTEIVCVPTFRLIRMFTIRTDTERFPTIQLRPWRWHNITWAGNYVRHSGVLKKSDEDSHKSEADSSNIRADNWIFNAILTNRSLELKRRNMKRHVLQQIISVISVTFPVQG